MMNTLQCLQCPVCTLFLHAGMSLESHLETHPKEQVIKALVQLACSTKCPEVFVSPPTSTVQRNVMIVNSTQYYRNDRRSQSSFISCNNSNDESDDETISENHQKLAALSFNSSVRNNIVKFFPNNSILPLTSDTQLPPPPYTTAIEENSTFSSNFSNFQQQQNSVNFDYSNENYEEVVDKEEEEEVDLETKQHQNDEHSQVTTAQYFEKENGDFILHESPTSNADEYTEEENGEFLLREKIIEKSPSVLHFNDEDKKPKDFSGLKVLSDVPVRVSDMTSSTGDFIIEYQNENIEPEINPFKSVIRTATNEPESSTSDKSLPLTRHSTKFFQNKQPKKLVVKFKKPVYQSTSDEIQIVDEIGVEKKAEEILEPKIEEKIFSTDEKHRAKYHKRKNHLLENFRKDECVPIELDESIKDESPVTAELKPESSLLQLLEMTTEEECVSDYIGPFTPLSAKFEIEENHTENENTLKAEPEVQIIEEVLPISIETVDEPKEIEQAILSFGNSSNNIKSENWLTKTEEETIKEIPIDAEAGPSNRIDYSFPNLFANEQFLYSPEERNRVPNILEFNQENDDGTTTWHRQSFSPQYVTQFENDRNSYMDLDACKTNNSINCDQAASVDSLNIRTDEKMPAKGEISEQESNGDNGEGSWNNQV